MFIGDEAAHFVLDAMGEVIVCTQTATQKLDVGGQEVWNVPRGGSALASDSEGAVCVARGDVTGHVVTAKIAATGHELWTDTYEAANTPCAAEITVVTSVAVSSEGSFYVAANCRNAANALVLKYGPGGERVWDLSVGGGIWGISRLFVDQQDDLLLAGGGVGGLMASKYDPQGSPLWFASYYPSSPDPVLTRGLVDATLDADGSVILTGEGFGASLVDWVTVKFSSSGTRPWFRRYDGPFHQNDNVMALAVSGDGSVYVVGRTAGPEAFTTLKLDAAGERQWLVTAPGGAAHAVAVDGLGGVYVAGFRRGSALGAPTLVKYSEAGEELWKTAPPLPANHYVSEVSSIIVSGGDFFVSAPGTRFNPETGDTFGAWVLAKLTGKSPVTFHRGDPNSSGTIDISDAIAIFGFLFLGDTTPTCKESADSNNDGTIDISDGILLLSWLFLSAAEPVAPGPTGEPCGVDTDAPGSPGDLGCAAYAPCQ
jgi:hypothetical protein